MHFNIYIYAAVPIEFQGEFQTTIRCVLSQFGAVLDFPALNENDMLWLQKHLRSDRVDFVGLNCEWVGMRDPQTEFLLIFCHSSSHLAKMCEVENPLAQWGANYHNVSFVYHKTLVNSLHEALHFFGCEDCYDSRCATLATCDYPRCIMRYGSSHDISHEQNLICGENRRKLRDFFSR